MKIKIFVFLSASTWPLEVCFAPDAGKEKASLFYTQGISISFLFITVTVSNHRIRL